MPTQYRPAGKGGGGMGNVVKFRLHSAARKRKSTKSSAVTRPPVTSRSREAIAGDSQTSPRRSLETVERLHPSNFAIAASSRSRDRIQFDNCMPCNVHGIHNEVKDWFAPTMLELFPAPVHGVAMGRVQKTLKHHEDVTETRTLDHTFLREWRLACNLSLEEAGTKLKISHSQLSRIERAKQEYTQGLLERAARVYKTSVWALLNSPPGQSIPEMFQAFQESIKPKI